MKLLVVGGAGHVGGILRPAFEARHECRYLDLRPIEGAEDRTVVGSLLDPEVLKPAAAGCDVLIQLAMHHGHRDQANAVDGEYDVHVKGMHRILEAAVEVGAKRVVYASSLSVYRRLRQEGDVFDETRPPDAVDLYGLTKRLGEVVCQAFTVKHPELSVFALQLVLPRTAEQWAAGPTHPRHNPNFMTGPEDLRDAWLRAIEHPTHTGYDAIFVCSDVEGKYLNLSKARRILGWEPQGR